MIDDAVDWRHGTLSDFCEVSPADPPLAEDSHFVPMGAVVIGRRFPEASEERHGRSGIRARANDVLFARITPSLENGKVGQIPSDWPPTGGSTEFLVIRPGVGLDPKFLYYWSLSPSVRRRAESRMTGTTGRMRLSKDDLGIIPMAVPPLIEQRRIVHILEDHFSRLDAAERELTTARKKLLQYKSGARAAAVAGVLRWPESRIGDLAVVGTGATPLRAEARYWSNASVPWITSGELSSGIVTEANQFISEDALAETSVKVWQPGTLLMAMYGEGKTRGTVAELKIAATTNQACAAISLLDPDPVDREWLKLVIESRYEAMRAQSSGGVQPNLNLGMVRQMVVPWPGRSQKLDRTREFEALKSGASRLASELNSGAVRAVALRRALLAAAFSGKVTGAASDGDVIEELAG